jgi:hypothetical protein
MDAADLFPARSQSRKEPDQFFASHAVPIITNGSTVDPVLSDGLPLNAELDPSCIGFKGIH